MSTFTSAPQRPDHRALDHTDVLTATVLPDRVPRTTLLSRIALRIALWLLLWSTRTATASPADVERQRARADRELQWLRRHLLLPFE